MNYKMKLWLVLSCYFQALMYLLLYIAGLLNARYALIWNTTLDKLLSNYTLIALCSTAGFVIIANNYIGSIKQKSKWLIVIVLVPAIVTGFLSLEVLYYKEGSLNMKQQAVLFFGSVFLQIAYYCFCLDRSIEDYSNNALDIEHTLTEKAKALTSSNGVKI